jgi:transportin-1
MAYSNSAQIGKYLDNFIKYFCLSIRFTEDSTEKQEAFTGLCKSIITNPNGLINHFPYFCDAICQYENPTPELNNLFNDLIYSYKTNFQDRWIEIIKKFPENLQKRMNIRFNIEF